MKHFTKTIIASLLLGTLASTAFAATDGSLDSTSSGTADISVVIPSLAKITGVGDLTSTTWNGTGDVDLNHTACIYSNSAVGYKVKITAASNPSSSPTTGYYIGSGATNQEVPYTMSWAPNNTGASADVLTHATNSSTYSAVSTLEDCGGTPNSTYLVHFAHAALLAVHPGTYTQTITILITPQ